LNCVDENLDDSFTLYLGYGNTYLYDLNVVGDNTLLCGTQQLNVPIEDFVYGQINFAFKINCNSNLTWSVNGSILQVPFSEYSNLKCNNIQEQKITITLNTIDGISQDNIDNLSKNIANIYQVNISRVNITTRDNEEINQNDELIVSFSNASDSSEISHSSLVYNFSNLDQSQLLSTLQSSGISTNDVKVSALTFNESVGTERGCTQQDNNGVFSLYFGDLNNCIQNGSNSIPITTTISIAVVIGAFSVIIIMVGILMAIPATRNAIFPTKKVRSILQAKNMEVSMNENSIIGPGNN